MKIHWSEIAGLQVFQTHRHADDRGLLEVIYDEQLNGVQIAGLEFGFKRILLVTSRQDTLRGIHKARKDVPEVKLVTCIAGMVREVLIDLRPDSKTFKKYAEVTLEPEIGNAILIPNGLGHAYEVLSNEATLVYALSTTYSPEKEIFINALDPELKIDWGKATYRSTNDLNSRNLEQLILDGII